MKLIYGTYIFTVLNGYFRNHIKLNVENYQFNKLPYSDAIGLSFYHNDYDEISNIIQEAKTRSENVFVYLSEPTRENFKKFVKENSDVQIFSDVILDEDIENFETVISWFIDPWNYYAEYSWPKKLLSQIDNNNFNKRKILDCMLGTKKEHRDIIEHLYTSSKVKKDIIFSYYKTIENIDEGIWDENVKPWLLDAHNVNGGDYTINRYSVLPVDVYNQSYYSIVAETTAFNYQTQFTEKVAKPILARRPFVVFAGQHYLKNLKKLGFLTFSSIIDESYDSEPNMEKRYKLAWEQVEKLCTYNPKEVYETLWPQLEHNQKTFLSTDWWEPIRKLNF
jgi:hypothetical protein